MDRFEQVNLLDFLENYGDSMCQKAILSYVCPLNPDVERFLHNNAITFAKQRIAITYLITSEYMGKTFLAGYFTLANKCVNIDCSSLSKTMQKRIRKFSQYDPENDRFTVAMPLIAQLGKNFNPVLPFHISGQDLLKTALDQVQKIEYMIGGKTTYIECDNQPKLFDFYTRAGFLLFRGRRQGGADADSSDSGNLGENTFDTSSMDKYGTGTNNGLARMLRYFKH